MIPLILQASFKLVNILAMFLKKSRRNQFNIKLFEYHSEVGIHVLILEAILFVSMVLSEERMRESSFHSDPLRWLQVHHLRQQINGIWVILKVAA